MAKLLQPHSPLVFDIMTCLWHCSTTLARCSQALYCSILGPVTDTKLRQAARLRVIRAAQSIVKVFTNFMFRIHTQAAPAQPDVCVAWCVPHTKLQIRVKNLCDAQLPRYSLRRRRKQDSFAVLGSSYWSPEGQYVCLHCFPVHVHIRKHPTCCLQGGLLICFDKTKLQAHRLTHIGNASDITF